MNQLWLKMLEKSFSPRQFFDSDSDFDNQEGFIM